MSKTWRVLVFDGQLWKNFDLHDFGLMPKSVSLHIARSAGAFVRSINFTGFSITTSDLITVTDSFRLRLLPAHTQLTAINLQRAHVKQRALHHLLSLSPSLLYLNVRGSKAMNNLTCKVLAEHCPQLLSLDASRCHNLDGDGIQLLCSTSISRGQVLALKELRISGMNGPHLDMFVQLGKAAPFLEVLDASYIGQMHNSYLEGFVRVTEEEGQFGIPYVILTAHEAGQQEVGRYFRRVTKLRHLNLSYCMLLTDAACSHLASAMPNLELLELAGIGAPLEDDGLVRLLSTTPRIRRLDLEDAMEITDAVIRTLTPAATPADGSPTVDQPGQKLEQLNISYATRVSNGALLALIRECSNLKALEVDNTHISSTIIREFVSLSRRRELRDASICAIDCRGISQRLVKDLASTARPRKGWRAYEARKLRYVDARDGTTEQFKGAQDECNPDLVVVKTFYSWQGVDAIATARAKKRNARKAETLGRTYDDSDDEFSDDVDSRSRSGRWWSSGQRLSLSGRSSPSSDREGCILM